MKKSYLFLFLSIFVFNYCSPKAERETVSEQVEVEEPKEKAGKKPVEVTIEKELTYKDHTLEDTYPYKDTTRQFQWDKIRERLILLDSVQRDGPKQWGILQNRKNVNGEAPLIKTFTRNAYNRVADTFGVERYQSVPIYLLEDSVSPERYGRDGSLVEIMRADSSDFMHIKTIYFSGDWLTNEKYVRPIADTTIFTHAIFVDRTNQNIATMEKVGSTWFVRSMNPATTGVHNPPYMQETPEGMFVFQEKKRKMIYLNDGKPGVGGFAPYASRFCNGGYIHGVPVNAPNQREVEFSGTLGTIPRSHMCVRNATSHAKFVYDNFPTEGTIIFVFD